MWGHSRQGGLGEALCWVSQTAGDGGRCQEGVWKELEGGARGIWKEFGMVWKPYVMQRFHKLCIKMSEREGNARSHLV